MVNSGTSCGLRVFEFHGFYLIQLKSPILDLSPPFTDRNKWQASGNCFLSLRRVRILPAAITGTLPAI